MKIRERLKNVGFWASLVGAVILILGAFGVEIAGEAADAAINGVCSLLIVFGIASDPTSGRGYLDGNGKEERGGDAVGAVSKAVAALSKLRGGDREDVADDKDDGGGDAES